MQSFDIRSDDAGTRLDIFLVNNLPGANRADIGKLIATGYVTVNGKENQKNGYKLKTEERIMVDTSPLTNKPAKISIPVIYEDDHVVVMDKPAGLLTHSKGSFNLEPTLASFLSTKLNDTSLNGNRAGIVHRLDRATSGVIIGAKDATTQKHLQKQFSTRNVKKTYHAVIAGEPVPSAAIINAPIARNPRKPQTFQVLAIGREARTAYRVIKTINKDGKILSYVELKPETGRTHQLRVHLSYIGHPIVGDRLYGHASDGLMLHASELEVTLPTSERKVFKSPLPRRIEELIE